VSKHDFNEKIVWITGASSGIGRALAFEFAKRGAVCALTSRSKEVLEELCGLIKKQNGKSEAYAGDVTDLEQMTRLANQIASELGPIDILMANAGTHIFSKPEMFDTKEYLNLMDINYGGILRSIEAVLPAMQDRGKGHIVGMASLAGFRGLPRAAAYGASKAAISHFLESARFHLEPFHIKVTIVNPGFVRTPLTDKNDFHMPFLTEPEKAAGIICSGIARERKEISFPAPFNWILKFMRVIPYFLYSSIINEIWKRQISSQQ
jgi:short-subunit dehydrogenase